MKKTFSKNLIMHNHKDIKKHDQNDLIEFFHHINACDEQLMKKHKIKQ